MFKRFIITTSLFCLLAVPMTGYAATSQMCWTEDSCLSSPMGGSFYGPNDETISVCGNEKDASGAKLGFCMPVGQSQTAVGFGGKQVFTHFGDFIQWIYKYGIQVAGILAVVVIIIAGFGWVTSGGSPDKVGAAKKKIGGAMMGLFLAVMSYAILNLINPYMVNLRMPRIWKINTVGLAPPYCDMIKDDKKVSETNKGEFKINPKEAECGKDFYVEETPDLTCKGRYCKGKFEACKNHLNGFEQMNDYLCSDFSKTRLVISLALESTLQNLAKGQWLFTALGTVVDGPLWLDQGGADFAKFFVKCDNGSTYSYPSYNLSYKDSGPDGYVGYAIKKVNGVELSNYNYQVEYNVTDATLSALEKKCDKGKAVSFFVSHELNMALDLDDPNFYISPLSADDDKNLVIGIWDDIKSKPGFSIEKLKTGAIYGQAVMTQSVIEKLGENQNT